MIRNIRFCLTLAVLQLFLVSVLGGYGFSAKAQSVEDTLVFDLPLHPGVKKKQGSVIRVTVRDNFVSLTGIIHRPAKMKSLAQLPKKYRPTVELNGLVWATTGTGARIASYPAALRIETNGHIGFGLQYETERHGPVPNVIAFRGIVFGINGQKDVRLASGAKKSPYGAPKFVHREEAIALQGAIRVKLKKNSGNIKLGSVSEKLSRSHTFLTTLNDGRDIHSFSLVHVSKNGDITLPVAKNQANIPGKLKKQGYVDVVLDGASFPLLTKDENDRRARERLRREHAENWRELDALRVDDIAYAFQSQRGASGSGVDHLFVAGIDGKAYRVPYTEDKTKGVRITGVAPLPGKVNGRVAISPRGTEFAVLNHINQVEVYGKDKQKVFKSGAYMMFADGSKQTHKSVATGMDIALGIDNVYTMDRHGISVSRNQYHKLDDIRPLLKTLKGKERDEFLEQRNFWNPVPVPEGARRIEVSPTGTLWVVTLKGSVQYYDGKRLKPFSVQFNRQIGAVDIATTVRGAPVVIGKDGRIWFLGRKGARAKTPPKGVTPGSIAVDRKGNVFVADAKTKKVYFHKLTEEDRRLYRSATTVWGGRETPAKNFDAQMAKLDKREADDRKIAGQMATALKKHTERVKKELAREILRLQEVEKQRAKAKKEAEKKALDAVIKKNAYKSREEVNRQFELAKSKFDLRPMKPDTTSEFICRAGISLGKGAIVAAGVATAKFGGPAVAWGALRAINAAEAAAPDPCKGDLEWAYVPKPNVVITDFDLALLTYWQTRKDQLDRLAAHQMQFLITFEQNLLKWGATSMALQNKYRKRYGDYSCDASLTYDSATKTIMKTLCGRAKRGLMAADLFGGNNLLTDDEIRTGVALSYVPSQAEMDALAVWNGTYANRSTPDPVGKLVTSAAVAVAANPVMPLAGKALDAALSHGIKSVKTGASGQ